MCNVLIEIAGLPLAMIMAGFLGRSIAQVATGEIRNDFIRFVAGITTGLLAGTGVGLAMKRISGRFIAASTEK